MSDELSFIEKFSCRTIFLTACQCLPKLILQCIKLSDLINLMGVLIFLTAPFKDLLWDAVMSKEVNDYITVNPSGDIAAKYVTGFSLQKG
jgi:hypothetical protein